MATKSALKRTGSRVVPSTGWQQVAGYPDFQNQPLKLADGSASGAKITADGVGNYSSIGAKNTDPNFALFNRNLGISGQSGVSTIKVDNLTAFPGGYDVYVYFAANNNPGGTDVIHAYSISDGTTTYFIKADETMPSYQGKFVQSSATTAGAATVGNYVKFSGLKSPSFTISAKNSENVTGGAAGFAGMQIVAAKAPPAAPAEETPAPETAPVTPPAK